MKQFHCPQLQQHDLAKKEKKQQLRYETNTYKTRYHLHAAALFYFNMEAKQIFKKHNKNSTCMIQL